MKKGDMAVGSWLVIAIIALIVIFIVIPAGYKLITGTSTPLLDSINKFLGIEETKEKTEEVKKDELAQYNSFLADLKGCIELEAVDCYCQPALTYLSSQTIELLNTGRDIILKIYSTSGDACKNPASETKISETELKGQTLYTEDHINFINVFNYKYKPSIKEGKLDQDNLVKADTTYFTRSKICSDNDNSERDFSKGIIYKLSKNKIILTKLDKTSLKSCQSLSPKHLNTNTDN